MSRLCDLEVGAVFFTRCEGFRCQIVATGSGKVVVAPCDNDDLELQKVEWGGKDSIDGHSRIEDSVDVVDESLILLRYNLTQHVGVIDEDTVVAEGETLTQLCNLSPGTPYFGLQRALDSYRVRGVVQRVGRARVRVIEEDQPDRGMNSLYQDNPIWLPRDLVVFIEQVVDAPGVDIPLAESIARDVAIFECGTELLDVSHDVELDDTEIDDLGLKCDLDREDIVVVADPPISPPRGRSVTESLDTLRSTCVSGIPMMGGVVFGATVTSLKEQKIRVSVGAVVRELATQGLSQEQIVEVLEQGCPDEMKISTPYGYYVDSVLWEACRPGGKMTKSDDGKYSFLPKP